MDAASLLSELLNNELHAEIVGGLCEELGVDKPTVEKITITVADRLECEWFRWKNKIKDEDVHLIKKN